MMHLGTAEMLRGDSWLLVGQDGGQSIDLGDATLFVFSDTLLADNAALRNGDLPDPLTSSTARFLANCAGVSTARTLPEALSQVKLFRDSDGWPREILPRTGRERLLRLRFWPEHGVLIEGLVYLFYVGIRQIDPRSTWGFEVAGSGLAVLDVGKETCRRIVRDEDWRLWNCEGGEIHWGVQTLLEGDTAYIFGTRRNGLDYTAVLARVSARNIADLTAYEYLSSPGFDWTSQPTQLTELVPCGSEYSVSFNKHLGCYLMVYVDGYSKILYFRTAPHPWGPYSEPHSVGGLPHREDVDLISLGFEHPAFAKDGGKTVLVSYCQPRFTQNSLVSITFA
jgi:hypothetical protein